MNNNDAHIIQACKRVLQTYETYLAAEKTHNDWIHNNEEYGAGAIRVQYEFKDGQLAEAAQEAYEDYERTLASLKALLP
jgi:hypothetical protein